MKSGVGALGSKPLTFRATKTGQPSASSTTTGWPCSSAGGVSRTAGSRIVARALDRDQHLAGDAADGQRVRAVGVDLELDGLLVEAEQRAYVLAGRACVGRQHDDPVVVLADAELARGADHPGRDVAVGLARGDLEPAGQDSAGQHDDDQVARREVVGAADDALRLTGAVGVGDVDGAPVDGLAVLLRLGLHREHAADHERAGDVATGALDGLELETGQRQPGRQLVGGHGVGDGDVVLDPGQGRLHRHNLRSRCRMRTRSGRRPRRGHAGRPWCGGT